MLELARHGVQLTRFKGLGEMNADQLRETTMDPASRTLARVTLEDATAADTIFSMLMGDQVAPRREFIEAHAKEVRFLDVVQTLQTGASRVLGRSRVTPECALTSLPRPRPAWFRRLRRLDGT